MKKFENLEEAQAACEQLETENVALLKENKELADLSADLRDSLKELNKQASAGKVIIEHNDKKYEVKAKTFKHNGKEYNAADLVDNEELTMKLVEIGAGFLEELNNV